LSAQNGQLVLKCDELKLQCGTAAKTESEDRYTGRENRHHDRDGTPGTRKSPASLNPVEILSKDRALSEYVAHYHAERNHQGKSNVLLSPRLTETRRVGRYNVASGWVGSCIITIKTPRKLTDKSRPMPMKLRPSHLCQG
jgi:hypothetical protein